MEMQMLEKELSGCDYPGRGIVIGKSEDGKKAVTAYFIMGRSENSRNRVFVEDGEGIRTQAFDPSKLSDPSLIIYAPVRVLGNDTIVTNGDQTDTAYTARCHKKFCVHTNWDTPCCIQNRLTILMLRQKMSIRMWNMKPICLPWHCFVMKMNLICRLPR